MNTVLLKLDNAHAKIYAWPEAGAPKKSLGEAHVDHHTHSKNEDMHKHQQKFFHEVAAALQGVDEIFVVGNSKTNSEFKHHLENHNHPQVLKAIVGMETIESHATDGEVKNKATEFFTKFRTFQKNY
jgi:hypothetical protein